MAKGVLKLKQVKIRKGPSGHLMVLVGGAGDTLRFADAENGVAHIKEAATVGLIKIQEAGAREFSLLAVRGQDSEEFPIDGRRETIGTALFKAYKFLGI